MYFTVHMIGARFNRFSFSAYFMKVNPFTIALKPTFIALAMIWGLSLSSCNTTSSFQQSSVVPAAQGYTKLKHDKNGNYTMYVSVKHLAGPERLTPPRKLYIVWLQTAQNGNRNVGQINIRGDMSGSLSTVTAFKPVKVFITAEDNANIAQPEGQTVLMSSSF